MQDFSTSFIHDKKTWEAFVLSRSEANFLQSWNWGVFHERLGKKVFRVAVVENEKIIAGALCVKEKAKRGTYLTIAGGPLCDWQNFSVIHFLFQELKILAAKEKCVFIRIRPQILDTSENQATAQKVGLLPSPMHLTADLTLQLDLTKSEEEILAAMRKNTRYDIRRSEKMGIVIKISNDPEQIKSFYEQQLYLAKKHGFVPFGYQFLYEQFRTFAADGQAQLFHSYLGDELLASAFILFYNHEAVYHYGVSTVANEKLPGSYACQWAAIQWAKAHGGLRYNFWGIAPEDQPNHRFAGVSLFKRGFGGEEVHYLPAHDLPIHWQYHVTKVFETARKKLRHL